MQALLIIPIFAYIVFIAIACIVLFAPEKKADKNAEKKAEIIAFTHPEWDDPYYYEDH